MTRTVWCRALVVSIGLLSTCGPGTGSLPFAMRADAAALALVFVSKDCEVSEAFGPTIRTLAADFAPRGVDFVLVYLDAGLAREDAVEHARAAYGPDCAVFVDDNGYLARLTNVSVTPAAAVLARDGTPLYRGRIDDRSPLCEAESDEPGGRRDLREALAALLDGKPIPHPETLAFGRPLEKKKAAADE